MAEYRNLRTSRNRNLIRHEEQLKLSAAKILIVGMSVGSNIVEALVSSAIGQALILVDMDIIEPSNLNRIRAPYADVGIHKVDSIAKKVSEIDPYIDQVHYKNGLNVENLIEILDEHKPDLIIDEIDSLAMKIAIRKESKSRRLPVIMAADDGENTLIDIERFDLYNELPIFGGRIPEDILNTISDDENPLPREQLGKVIGKYFVGLDNIPLRMFESLFAVGKTIPSWPQLGNAATLSGVVLAYVARKIILGDSINDGRFLISIDELLDVTLQTESHKKQLQNYINLLSD